MSKVLSWLQSVGTTIASTFGAPIKGLVDLGNAIVNGGTAKDDTTGADVTWYQALGEMFVPCYSTYKTVTDLHDNWDDYVSDQEFFEMVTEVPAVEWVVENTVVGNTVDYLVNDLLADDEPESFDTVEEVVEQSSHEVVHDSSILTKFIGISFPVALLFML